MRSRYWVVLAALLFAVAVLDLAVLTVRLPPGGPEPTARVRAGRDAIEPPDQVVDAMKRRCLDGVDRVRLDLVQGDAHLQHWFECSDVRDAPATTSSRLLALVALRHHATERADEIARLQRQIGIAGFGRGGWIWALGTGVENFSCSRVADDRFHRQEMGSAVDETPLHWTQVEAATIGGACPERLPRFLQSISAIGYPDVATEVRAELVRAGVSMP